MATPIPVRLVPKPPVDSGLLGGSRVSNRPDSKLAQEALDIASNSLKLNAKLTPLNAVEVRVTGEELEQTFGVQLRETTLPGEDTTVLTTTAEVKVPDNLKDTIAFAYVPSDPDFFALSATPPQADVYHLALQDVLKALKGDLCHADGILGKEVRVIIADTGFADHPYFQQQGYTIERVATLDDDDPSDDTKFGHGTGVCANTLIMAPQCLLTGVKHTSFERGGSAALSLEVALELSPRIISCSWGWAIDNRSRDELKESEPNLFWQFQDIENIVNDALLEGILVICAAGNGKPAFPASMPGVLAVGGVTLESDKSLVASSFASSFRSKLYPGRQVPDVCGIVGEFSISLPMRGHIMLPTTVGSEFDGKNLPPELRGHGWSIFSGTSSAAPQIAGVAALMLQANPSLQPREIISILRETALDVNAGTSATADQAEDGLDLATGAGLVNAHQACLRALRFN